MFVQLTAIKMLAIVTDDGLRGAENGENFFNEMN